MMMIIIMIVVIISIMKIVIIVMIIIILITRIIIGQDLFTGAALCRSTGLLQPPYSVMLLHKGGEKTAHSKELKLPYLSTTP